jgi:hypothetical protein
MVKNMKPAMMATTITRVAIPMVSSFDAGRLVRSLGAPFLSISLNIPRHVGFKALMAGFSRTPRKLTDIPQIGLQTNRSLPEFGSLGNMKASPMCVK